MITITTNNINGRADWFHAHALVNGRSYDSFMSSRFSAFSEVLRQIAAKGYLTI